MVAAQLGFNLGKYKARACAQFFRLAIGFLFVVASSVAVAAPVHLRLTGEVESASTYWPGAIQLPPSIVKGAPVEIDFSFEPVVLKYPEAYQHRDDDDLGSASTISAEQVAVMLMSGFMDLDGQTFDWVDAKLFAIDNKLSAVCAGFSCYHWVNDVIELSAQGDASSLENGVSFFTLGGLASPSHAVELPSSLLKVGADLGDVKTWNSFPDSTLYINFRSADSKRSAYVTVLLTDAFALPVTGDYDHNNRVDAGDYSLWQATWGSTSDARADGNGNRVIDAADYVLWLNLLGNSLIVGQVSPVPEPAAFHIVVVAALLLSLRTRRIA